VRVASSGKEVVVAAGGEAVGGEKAPAPESVSGAGVLLDWWLDRRYLVPATCRESGAITARSVWGAIRS
jgi:hypothetical protein